MKHNHYTMLAKNAIKSILADLPEDANIGVGVSGGADSLALLAGLSNLYKNQRSQQVHVIIIDHQLQEVTAEVAQSTASKAREYGFHPHIVPVNIVNTSAGLEADARTARYEVFENIIHELNLQAFLIGHTKSDQAEQVLLGLVRGSGTKSISGMREVRGVYRRPFLNVLSRSETELVCRENNLDFWVDPHNSDEVYKRVCVRNFLNDVNEKLDVNLVNPLVKTARIASEDSDALDFYANVEFEKFENSGWNVDSLALVPEAIRKRAYRLKLSELGVRSDSITFDLVNRVDDFIVSWKGQKEVNFSNNVRVLREGKKLVFKQ